METAAGKASMELHFREGFTGQTVEISRGGEVLAKVRCATRMQTGLAKIERLSVSAGDEVTLRVLGSDDRKVVKANPRTPFVSVHLTDEGLDVAQLERTPGYL